MKTGKNIDRRKFFMSAGLSAVGLSLISKSPFKFFTGSQKSKLKEEKIKLKINPTAVMRNKKA